MVNSIKRYKILNIKKKAVIRLLVILIFIDFIFLIISGIHRYTPYLNDVKYLLTRDGSYAEIFQYVKEIFLAALFFILAYKHKIPGYFIWSVLFAYFFLDDAFRIHEIVGGIIAGGLPFDRIFGLRAKDLGELAVTAFFGLIFLGGGIACYFKCGKKQKKIWRKLLFLIILLAGCGVGFDMLHSILDVKNIPMVSSIQLGSIFGAIEDFGEMVVMSLCVWYAVVIYNEEELWMGKS